MIEIRPRESVVLAEDFDAMVAWYQAALGLELVRKFEDGYHFANFEGNGVRIGIASAKEMGVAPNDRKNNSVVLQFEVDDVKAFFEHLQASGGSVTFGPNFDEENKFWFGGFHDLEGNPFWVVDSNCP